MTELDLLNVIGYAQDVHILDADEIPVKKKIIPYPSPLFRTIAAVLTLILALSLFLMSPIGIATAAAVRDQFEWFLDILLPPKDEVLYVEGLPEAIQAEGRKSEEMRIQNRASYSL